MLKTMMRHPLSWLLLLCVLGVAGKSQASCGVDCTWVLTSDNQGLIEVLNPQRADEAMPPFSTFKIALALIALDAGVVEELEQPLTFDPQLDPVERWWPKPWYAKPLPLREAFQVSALPVFRQLARQIGEQAMTSRLHDFDYGNADISSGIDRFWLDSHLKISARAQMAFIQRLARGELPVTADSLSLFKQVMLVEASEDYRLYAKTGAGLLAPGMALGWYVGFVEKDDDRFYFALNMDAQSTAAAQKKAVTTSTSRLKRAGVL